MRPTFGLLSCCLAALVAACNSADTPTNPLTVNAARQAPSENGGEHISHVNILDACDPTTFNAVLGPGACTRSGGVTFDQFIAQLTKHQRVAAWRFAPQLVQTKVGDLLVATNKGGEEHTFTEVEEFGGGIVPQLNALAGLTEQAPECLALTQDDRLSPGESFHEEVEEEGVEHYQCCIHPWMRATVVARLH